MHFALPPRKTSHPPPYVRAARSSASSSRRRKQLEVGASLILGLLTLYLIFHYLFSSSSSSSSSYHTYSEPTPAGTPSVVIVTVLDEESMSYDYMQKIKTNREEYASRHGYANFFTNASTYIPYLASAPRSWALVPALRHAMTLYPHTAHFFSLSPHALIMAPTLSVHDHILAPQRLESLMLKDIAVVPPDSVIHTFDHLKGEKVDLVLTQDTENLAQGSFVLRAGEWATFFLDTWFDPLYRGYNFQKAEGHALEHIVQWHPTILAKVALVPQRILNSYNFEVGGSGDDSNGGGGKKNDQLYQDGDFVIVFAKCDSSPDRECEKELGPWYDKWRGDMERAGGGSGGRPPPVIS